MLDSLYDVVSDHYVMILFLCALTGVMLTIAAWLLPDEHFNRIWNSVVGPCQFMFRAIYSIVTAKHIRKWWQSSYLRYFFCKDQHSSLTIGKRQYGVPKGVRDTAISVSLGTNVRPPDRTTVQDTRPPYSVVRPLTDWTDRSKLTYRDPVQVPGVLPVPPRHPQEPRRTQPAARQKPAQPAKPKAPVVPKPNLPAADLKAWEEITALVRRFATTGITWQIPQPMVKQPGVGATISAVQDNEDVVVGYVSFSDALQQVPGWTSQAAPGVSGPMELYIAIDPNHQPVWEVVSYYGVYDARSKTITYHGWRTGTIKQQPSIHDQSPSGEEIGVQMKDVLAFVDSVISSMIREIVE